MAGIGAESVTPIRPDLATNLQPINFAVEQNAVAALSDAFRQGVITSEDIIERYGTRAKTREKAEIQGLDEFLSPQAIEARKAQAQLMGEKTKSEIALLPIEEQTRRAQLEATRIAAEQGDSAAVRKFAIEHGFGPFLSQVPTGGSYTAENAAQDRQAYQDAVRYEQAIKGADGILKDIDPLPNKREFTDEQGAMTSETNYDEPILVSKTGAGGYKQEQAQKAGVLRRMSPQEWIASGRPTAGEFVLGVKPTEKPAGQQSPTLQPVSEVVTPRKTTEVEERKADGSVKITRTVVEPTTHPNAPTSIEDLKPGQSFKAAPASNKAPTDVQGRAQLGLPRFDEASSLMDELKASGYNPAGNWESASSFLPGPLKPEDRQKFELAKSAFAQGVLRLESGAAISVSENKNYGEVFFPKWGDSPAVMQAKEQLRSEVASMAAGIAAGGAQAIPEVKARADAIKARANAVAPAGPATSTQAGRPGIEPEVRHTLSSGQGQVIKRGGRYTVVSTNAPVAK